MIETDIDVAPRREHTLEYCE